MSTGISIYTSYQNANYKVNIPASVSIRRKLANIASVRELANSSICIKYYFLSYGIYPMTFSLKHFLFYRRILFSYIKVKLDNENLTS